MARMASLIGTCKLNGINPQAYLEHVLDKILNGHMQDEIKSLLPWTFSNGSIVTACLSWV